MTMIQSTVPLVISAQHHNIVCVHFICYFILVTQVRDSIYWSSPDFLLISY